MKRNKCGKKEEKKVIEGREEGNSGRIESATLVDPVGKTVPSNPATDPSMDD